jgi:hypothetical protein
LLAFRSFDHSVTPIPGLLSGAALTVTAMTVALMAQARGRDLLRDAWGLLKSALGRKSVSGARGF